MPKFTIVFRVVVPTVALALVEASDLGEAVARARKILDDDYVDSRLDWKGRVSKDDEVEIHAVLGDFYPADEKERLE